MIKHIVLWQLKDELNEDEKACAMKKVKIELESLSSKLKGIAKLEVHIKPLDSSNADMMLDSAFFSKEALENYQIHPEHQRIADTFVRPIVKSRLCMDFED